MAEWAAKSMATDRSLGNRAHSARIGTATGEKPGRLPSAPYRPISSGAERISGPIMGVDGKPLDLGQADWHLSDAKMSKQFLELQQSNLSGLDKLNAKLRKEYDTAKLANKRKMKELQFISSELSQIERVLSGSERSSGPAAAAEATVLDCDAKIQEVQDACQQSAHSTDMYDFMMNRLRDETKSMDLDIERLGKEVKSLVAEHESSALMLHQAQAQKTRAIALVHTLTRHLEVGRTQRKLKMDKMEGALSEQESRLRAFEDRERKRMTLSLIPRGDLDEDGEDRLKQLFLVRKIYNNMLTRRLRDDQRRTDRLANAYQRIRTATGLNDVDSIIQKYKSRDLTVATLNAQMKAARDRVDMLASERRQLVWALDEAQTMGASALEARALYNSVEEYDRKTADAGRKVRESRERLNRISVTLEECRACIAKMMDKMGLDSTSISGVVAGTAGAPSPEEVMKEAVRVARAERAERTESPLKADATEEGQGAAASGRARRGSFAGAGNGAAPASTTIRSTTVDEDRPGSTSSVAGMELDAPESKSKILAKIVHPDQLEQSLSLLETRVGQLLAHLAAVYEREEAAHASNAKSKSKIRRAGAGASTMGGGRSVGAPLDATAAPVTESDAAAHRMSVAVLTDKASSRVFQRMMTMEPDTSERNVRINARLQDTESNLPSQGNSMAPRHDRSVMSPPTASDDVAAALHKSAADLSKLLHGAGAGAVVDRVSLKRLSSMVATTMGSNVRRTHIKRPEGEVNMQPNQTSPRK